MVKPAAIDASEFARFVLTGIAAASGNLAVTWLARLYESFEISLLAGIAAGLAISFALSKWFAFGSRSWRRAGREVPRFLIVYAVSSATYWVIAVVIGWVLLSHGLSTKAAEICGILIGAGTMTLTSYFGHRLFTYRTYRSAATRLGGLL
jgi:putative flippase GtrA